MAQQSDHSERRQFPRLKESCQVRFKRVEAQGPVGVTAEALTVNISGGGICFTSPQSAQTGELLAIELALPEFATPVIALGRVIWCDEQGPGRHEIAMEFWWVGWGDDGAQKAISGHIRKALEKA